MKKLATIVTDIDSVLLDWVSQLPHFLVSKGLSPDQAIHCYVNKTYCESLTQLFSVNCEQQAFNLFTEYNESEHMRLLDPYKLSEIKHVVELSKHFNFVGLTCIGESLITKEYRMACLNTWYSNIFLDLFNIPFNTSKESYFKQIEDMYGEIALFIDDRDKHVKEGLSAGVDSFAYSDINFNEPIDLSLNRFNSWLDVKKYLYKKYDI